jgi:hypothetical protein
MQGRRKLVKRIVLMLTVAGALLVPTALFVGSAGAANPHGDPSDPNGSCGPASSNCNNGGLNQSNGCNANSSPSNPHCVTAETPPATSTPPASTPAVLPPAATTPPQQGVAGATAGKKSAGDSGNVGAAEAVNGAPPQQLAFTGLNAVWLAFMGAGLLGAGLAVRRRSQSV